MEREGMQHLFAAPNIHYECSCGAVVPELEDVFIPAKNDGKYQFVQGKACMDCKNTYDVLIQRGLKSIGDVISEIVEKNKNERSNKQVLMEGEGDSS